MRNSPFSLFFTAALALASLVACTPAKTPTPAATPTASPQPIPTQPTQATSAGCRVESSLIPTPDATQVAQYPLPGPGDWSKGPENAALTFIEYGDYQ